MKKGISLIVLVITIIVMIILAASVVITLNNTGIINKANEAVDVTNLEQVRHAASMFWAEAFMSDKRTQEELEEAVLLGLNSITGMDLTKYEIIVTTTGVQVEMADIKEKIDWDAILADVEANPLNYKHPEQTKYSFEEMSVIGIGTDGKVLNLDLWEIIFNDDFTEVSLGGRQSSYQLTGYDMTKIVDGKIQGKMPQYICLHAELEEEGINQTFILPVTKLEFTFRYNDKNSECPLKEIPEIPETVTYISEKAFYGCNNITSITIPKNVTKIGTGAFAYCTKLTNIKFHKDIEEIGSYAFEGCTALTSITIPSKVKTIFPNTFKNCTNLTNITLHNDIEEIDSYAFEGCTALTSITIPSKVKKLSDSIFKNCTNLTNITLHNDIEEIGYYAFEGCTALTNINIPSGVKSIGSNAFKNVPHITYNGTATGAPWGAKAIN